MRKTVLILLALLTLQSSRAGDFNDTGVISNRRFFPLQIDVGLVSNKKLIDEKTDTFLALGLFLIQQRSAVLSFAFIANTLQNNCGIQLNPFPIGVATDRNYGISVGFENYCKKCCGIQIGILNHLWAGEEIEKHKELLQIIGVNIADTVFLGVVNDTDKIQIGLLNNGRRKTYFQLGLLNYNPGSYLPWMPLVNFDMGRK